MALEAFQITKVLDAFISKEVELKKSNPRHHIFLKESYLIKALDATSNEDIKNIRICASTYIDTFNYATNQGIKIESDIDEYEMARARTFREQQQGPRIYKNSKSGCLVAIVSIVVLVHISVMFFM